jgi:hypothetical protein
MITVTTTNKGVGNSPPPERQWDAVAQPSRGAQAEAYLTQAAEARVRSVSLLSTPLFRVDPV